MGAPADPWTIERARRPGAKLIRVIDLEHDTQRWDLLKVLPEALDYELDGCTLIYPARADRTPADIANLIALYDELYHEQLAAEKKAA